MLRDGTTLENRAGKYLTFFLNGESYGISVLKIREIIRQLDITVVAPMPDYVRGVINLRGKIIPVVDLRLKFGLGASQTTAESDLEGAEAGHGGGAPVNGGFKRF